MRSGAETYWTSYDADVLLVTSGLAWVAIYLPLADGSQCGLDLMIMLPMTTLPLLTKLREWWQTPGGTPPAAARGVAQDSNRILYALVGHNSQYPVQFHSIDMGRRGHTQQLYSLETRTDHHSTMRNVVWRCNVRCFLDL